METCDSIRRTLEEFNIVCEIRNREEFPDGTQGPELWVREQDYHRAKSLVFDLMREC